MQPEQIKKAAEELWYLCLQSPHPASEVISGYTRSRRYIGSKDRKKLTEYVWKMLRFKAHIEFYMERGKTFQELLDIEIQDCNDMPDWVRLECPEWLLKKIPDAENELKAMLTNAPTILRANGNRNEIIKKLAQEGIIGSPTPLSPYGIKLDKRYNLNLSETYKKGLVEVQDEGSQLIALETQVCPEQSLFDMCAGAGGKSLFFAQMMKNKGSIIAYDISSRSLIELEKRAQRAHANIIHTTLDFPKELFDVVVIDAPCSGTGTCRRMPDAKWKITQTQFQNLIKTQAELLEKGAPLTQEKLCYMTCSLTNDENEAQIQNFLKKHSDFILLSQKRFSPFQSNTDGFYVAIMKKK